MAATLYGANVSPFVRKCRVYLAEKGIDYVFEPVNPFDPPASYRDISPLGKIPAFKDGDRTLADSSIICTYLERTHPTPALYPADDYAYARALWIEEFIDGGFVPKVVGGVFFPLVVAPLMMKQPLTPEGRAGVDKVLAEDAPPLWTYLERELGTQDYFIDNTFSIADIAVASAHVNLHHAGVDVDSDAYPHLAGFLGRIWARPSFDAVIAEESPTWSRRAG